MHDVYWTSLWDSDPFEEVRPMMTSRRVIAFPRTRMGRIRRKVARALRGRRDARDLFDGIDVTFPMPLCDRQGVPYVFWLPDFQYEHLRHLYRPEHYEWTARLYRGYVAEATRIAVSSEFGRQDFARFFPDKIALVDVLRFCSVPDRDWWAIDPVSYADGRGLTRPFFVISNQFTEHKNHLTVMAAVKLLRDRGHEVHVACTGSDYDFRGMRYFERVQEYVREHGLGDRVRLLGLCPRPEQIAILRRSVAVLQPSRFEGWSTVIEDAKVIGKPVIASDFPVHREQLVDRVAEFVGMDDVEGWAAALLRMSERRTPGPHSAEEYDARSRQEQAMRECGTTFVRILTAAARSGAA
jgi:glycosyltransferase involved in cell wall biosynthesis